MCTVSELHDGYTKPVVEEDPPKDYESAMRRLEDAVKARRWAEKEAERYRKEIEAIQPMLFFVNAVCAAGSCILVGELAKILRGNSMMISQEKVFSVLRQAGYLHDRPGPEWNMPTKKAMDRGLLDVTENTAAHPDGHTTTNKTVKVTGKGQVFFVEWFLSGRALKEVGNNRIA
ncbi:phage antirepressor KilAC domain-containing protein [Corynebacterium uropygiale]|uniref:Phage antirepressor KilAC domain-containing protein n=1 Tax=Corynebacterium uropygiale TaxID=1775911 RepID=A0A9X1QRC8_9CORY|nr:phage antirepressor KilAC domain-containing protein [Corynebacterium uropygiale]MCF4006775.1 phage antirepressor KilAC domain-containing protein [Corynebacterium uropygiale]